MKYVVSTPWGTFTRRTARKYTFVVTACGQTEAHLRARAAIEQAELERRRDTYLEGIQLGRIPPGAYPYDDIANYPAYVRGIEQHLADGPAKLAAKLAASAERMRLRRGIAMGWCGRRDLADKTAAKAQRDGYANVHIYAVTTDATVEAGQEVA